MILRKSFRWLMAVAAFAVPAGLSGYKPAAQDAGALERPAPSAAVFRHYL